MTRRTRLTIEPNNNKSQAKTYLVARTVALPALEGRGSLVRRWAIRKLMHVNLGKVSGVEAAILELLLTRSGIAPLRSCRVCRVKALGKDCLFSAVRSWRGSSAPVDT